MKFGQLTEDNTTDNLLENDTQNRMEELVPDSALKNQNCAYLWISSQKFYTACISCMTS